MLFDVAPEHIAALSDGDLRILIGRLCEAEVRTRGHAPVGVTYGGNQSAPDGGIDVRADVPAAAAGGFIPRPLTGFQVKAEDMPRGSIAAEMRPGGTLRPSIGALARGRGAYIIVSSKGSVADAPLRERLSAMQEAVADDPAAPAMHLDFYDRTRIATWVNGYPAEVAWVRDRIGEPLTGWRPFRDWSSSPEEVGAPYLLDGGVRLVEAPSDGDGGMTAEQGIGTLRAILRRPGGTVRLVGLSGVGKTRLVQALFDQTLGTDALDPTLAVYTDISDGPNPQPLNVIPRLEATGRPHVLIVDNCGADLHGRLAKRVRESAARISLITVEYDIRQDEPEGTEVFRLEPASSDVIEKVLERHHPRLTGAERSTIASFSEGNARIALAIASTATERGSLANLGDRALFERLFHQGQEEDPSLLRASQALSLVYSFDGETLDRPEADLCLLASLVGMTPEDLYRHVAELVRRQLVQKRTHWRAVLPHALAHRLAKGALQDIPPRILRTRLLAHADERLLKSFSRRLGCLHDSPEARQLVVEWLSDTGRLGRIGALDDLEVVLLENVAPVSPEGVLRAISRAASAGIEGLARGGDRAGRIVLLLRSIAYDPAHFDEAVALIAAFAADQEKSNNVADARRVFTSLFHAYHSGTHAPATQRADLLRRMARGEVAGSLDLAAEGLDAMLECHHFSSSLPFDFGSRKRDFGLEPRGAGKRDWFHVALSLAREFDSIPRLRVNVRQAIGRRFECLSLLTDALGDVVALAKTFAAEGGWVEGWARVRAAERVARKSGREAEAATLAGLADDTRPGSRVELVAAYILDDNSALLDSEGDLDEDGGIERALARLDETRIVLARDLAGDEEALWDILPRLVTCEQQGVRIFGRELGKESPAPRDVWGRVVSEITSQGSTTPVGGFASSFLRGIADRDQSLAEELLDDALRTQALHHLLVHMQAVVGLWGGAVDRLVEAALLPTVPVWTFRDLAHGGATQPLDGAQLRRLLLTIGGREGGIGPALEVMRMRLFGLKRAGAEVGPDDQEAGVELIDRVLFDEGDRGPDRGYEELIAACFMPGRHDDAVRRICMRIRNSISNHTVRPGDVAHAIAAFGRSFPRVVLDVFVAGSVQEPYRLRALGRQRPGSRGGVLNQVDGEIMLAWAHEDPGVRFEALACVVQPWISEAGRDATGVLEDEGPRDWSPIALRLLHEAPDPLPVLAAYLSRLHPSSYSGSLAGILTHRARLLDRLLDDPDKRISARAALARKELLEEAARQREREDAEARSRDQRFQW